MAMTDAEKAQVLAIEEAINQLYIVIDNLAAKKQLQELMLLIQGEFTTLKNRVTTLESEVTILQNKLS